MGFAVAGLGDITVGQAVSQWFTRRRGLALGIVYTGSNLGGAFLTRASGFVAEADSWRTAFFLMVLFQKKQQLMTMEFQKFIFQ